MAHPYFLAASAAFLVSVSQLTCAYSGDLDAPNPGLPVMMQFENSQADTTTAQSLTDRQDRPSSPDVSLTEPAKAAGDQFQRYFDRHYRAHLVLDAAAHRDTDVK